MAGKVVQYTPAERKLIYRMVLVGRSADEVIVMLERAGGPVRTRNSLISHPIYQKAKSDRMSMTAQMVGENAHDRPTLPSDRPGVVVYSGLNEYGATFSVSLPRFSIQKDWPLVSD